MWPMDDQTRRVDPSNETEFLGADDRTAQFQPNEKGPRQYMPDETNYQAAYPETQFGGHTQYGGQGGYGEPEPYEQPYRPPSDRQPYSEEYDSPKRSGKAGGVALGIVALLLALAAIVLFFLWRGAEGRANQPPPAPVTLTETETVTTTPEGLLDGLFGRNRDGDPQVTIPTDLPEDMPTDIPTEIPPELQDEAEGVVNDLQGFLDDLFGSGE
nr:Uncharacterised protein [Streptococcus thermophilus]